MTPQAPEFYDSRQHHLLLTGLRLPSVEFFNADRHRFLFLFFTLVTQVGKYKSKLEAQGWEYEMQVSFLEIYNEQIRDLLRENNGTKVTVLFCAGLIVFMYVCTSYVYMYVALVLKLLFGFGRLYLRPLYFGNPFVLESPASTSATFARTALFFFVLSFARHPPRRRFCREA